MSQNILIPADHADRLVATLRDALAGDRFIDLLLSGYAGPDDTLKRITARRIMVKRVWKISFTYRHQTRDIVKNMEVDAALDHIAVLARQCRNARLCMGDADLLIDGRSIKSVPPSKQKSDDTGHDRVKQRALPVQDQARGQGWMHALGLSDAQGKIIPAMQDKYKQINRYIELLEPLLRDRDTGGDFRIADMGAGKGYLTFALYDYLNKVAGKPARITGVEWRADLVDQCNRIAGDHGFSGLTFVQGDIAGFDAAGVDMLIALHACDTATDDAIAKGILAGASLIVVAPCCHKQIRRAMEAGLKKEMSRDPLLRYGVFAERQAEMITDALRALILNACGYQTKLFEFVSDAHTPKNVMITAVRTRTMDSPDPTILAEIAALKARYKIDHHALEGVLEGF